MTYRELEHELEENLDKLIAMYEKWEVSEKEVERYKQYIKKTLFCYRVIEWKQKEQNLEVVWVEKK
jgi:hypothetical protein